MDFSIGTGLTVFSVCATFISIFYRLVPSRIASDGEPEKGFCKEHMATTNQLTRFTTCVEQISKDIGELKIGQVSTHKRLDDFILAMPTHRGVT